MRILPIALIAGLLLAGCAATDVTPTSSSATVLDDSPLPVDIANVNVIVNFTERLVDAAVSYSSDLYEPTMEVCEDGSIYITGHTILADTTGAPVFGSSDDGESWRQLPFLSSAALPAGLPGATPPPSDEIFLSCGEDGWLYGVDITLATFPVNGWSGNGAELAYHNANAYDEAQVALQASDCLAAPAKDRPWGAYANGKLLMVSNPAAGPAQVGVLPVPPGVLGLAPTPVGVGAVSGGGHWNVCAGTGYHSAGCSIPGIPDIRADGQFAVPQLCDGRLYLIQGNAQNIMNVDVRSVFEHSTGGEITSVYGQAHYDAEGTLFVGISNNTVPDAQDNRTGQMRFATSTDGGATFSERVFSLGVGKPVVHFYMDPNDFGAGALVVWAVEGETDGGYDYYMGHLFVGADGLPTLTNVALAVNEGPQPSAHVTGAAVGPDGRSYLAMFRSVEMLGTPLSVYVQTEGPTLPVNA
ncbi:MAG: hypothetical protein AABX89_03080 [Candidatus Thermoplasmatota archaeon]